MDLVHFSVINPIQEIVLGTRVNHGKTHELFIFTFGVCMLVCNNKYIQLRVGHSTTSKALVLHMDGPSLIPSTT